MKRKNTIFSKLYVVLCLAFFYLPILVTMIFSFNSSKSLTRFTGFSLRWYGELINNMEISKAVYVSVTVAILATFISSAGNHHSHRTFKIQKGAEGDGPYHQ